MPTRPTLEAHDSMAAVQALMALRAHPLRTFLGMLAIVVAVATIAIVTAALDGVQQFAQRNASRAFGSDTFVLAQIASSGSISRRELERKLERHPPLKRSDARFLAAHAGERVIYAPSTQRVADVSVGGRTYENAAVSGVTFEMSLIRDLGIEAGRFLQPYEESAAAQVAVIGADLADALFPGRDPLGGRIRIAGRGFDVVGVQGRLGTSGGASLDRNVWIPLPTFERVFGAPQTLQVFARAADGVTTPQAEDHAVVTMRARRQLGPGEENNFDLLSPEAARDFVFRLTQRIGAAALPISVMALLAAVVVITTPTLVSVSQRTREIGVRRAIGARRSQIAREVVAESLLIAIGGGLLGLLAALATIGAAARATGLPLSLDWGTAAWALVASAGSGLVAGWYPARRAMRIDVIAAIRTE
jgi:putative ABC transport system permease protein